MKRTVALVASLAAGVIFSSAVAQAQVFTATALRQNGSACVSGCQFVARDNTAQTSYVVGVSSSTQWCQTHANTYYSYYFRAGPYFCDLAPFSYNTWVTVPNGHDYDVWIRKTCPGGYQYSPSVHAYANETTVGNYGRFGNLNLVENGCYPPPSPNATPRLQVSGSQPS